MAGKENPTSFLEREIRMVLVGKTGVGKSETGNTICGAGKKEPIFKACKTAMSVTKTCKQHSFKRFGNDLQLVDVPGFCDTSRSDEDIKYEVMKCVGMSSPGIHAILFIVSIGRFTDEDTETLEKFLHCFGKDAKRFVIVVFTGKDDLDRDGNTLANYIGDYPASLKQFLYETNLRFIDVNNLGTDEEKEKFTKHLIDKVKKMVNEKSGQCYTNEMYEKCEADLREAEKKEKLEGKRQEEFEKILKQDATQLQKQRNQIKKLEKELEKERMSREKDQEDQLKDSELRAKNEEENKRREEEEKKRQAEQKETEENMRRELKMMKDLRRKQTEIYEQKKEELRLEEARKQIREKVENDDTSYLGQFWQWLGSWFS